VSLAAGNRSADHETEAVGLAAGKLSAGAVAGVVLAAGASRRLGSAKQMVRLGEQTLLERAVGVAVEARLRPVYVVVAQGAEWSVSVGEKLSALGERVVMVVNREAEEGMASSIRAGVAAVGGGSARVGGVVILACDQPAVTAEHLRRLMAGGDAVVSSGYAGRKGVPAYFPAQVFEELLRLRGDVGARELLREAQTVELEGGELDVDTVEDLELAVQRYGRRLAEGAKRC